MTRLSTLECMALAAATGTQRVRALKKLIDDAIDTTTSLESFAGGNTEWSTERWIAHFLDEIYEPQNPGERSWLLKKLIAAYQASDRGRLKALRVMADNVELLRIQRSMGSHTHSLSTHNHSHLHTLNSGSSHHHWWSNSGLYYGGQHLHGGLLRGVTFTASSGTIR